MCGSDVPWDYSVVGWGVGVGGGGREKQLRVCLNTVEGWWRTVPVLREYSIKAGTGGERTT